MDEAKSYLLTEAAELTGLSVPALRKRIVRKTLRGFRSNEDGLWRVWLEPDDIVAAQASHVEVTDTVRLLPVQADGSLVIKALERESSVLREALARERARADRVEAEVGHLRERVGRAEAGQARTEWERDAERSAREQAEVQRDASRSEVVETRHLLGQAEGVAAGLREGLSVAEVSRREAEGRYLALEAERDSTRELAEQERTARQEVEARLAEVRAEMEAANRQATNVAELEAAKTRAEEAEARATEAKRQVEDAERRAAAVNARMDRIQQARIAQAQAATAAASPASKADPVPPWWRVFGRKR